MASRFHLITVALATLLTIGACSAGNESSPPPTQPSDRPNAGLGDDLEAAAQEPVVAGEAPANPQATPAAPPTAGSDQSAAITAPLVIETTTTSTTAASAESTSTTASSNVDAMIELAGEEGSTGPAERIPLLEQLATGLRGSAGVTP